MAFSKGIIHCRRSIITPIRKLSSDPNALDSESKLSIKTMSLVQWKLLNQVKEYILKFTNDKNLQATLNKEFAQLLQKFQPSIYGNLRLYDSSDSTKNQEPKKTMAQQSTSGIGNVISGIKVKIGAKEDVPATNEATPKWKNEPPKLTKASIITTTSTLINAISTATTDKEKLTLIEEFSDHLQKFPEMRLHAVKEGGIRVMLQQKFSTRSPEIIGAVNEVLALLGYVSPLPGRGIRILAIDGGGVRGILVIAMLKKLEEITGKRVYEMFDYICGVSTGAILASTLGLLQYKCEQLAKDYVNISTKIFTQSAIKGTGNLMWSHSYYNTELWEKLLKEQLGDGSLISTNRLPNCPKFATVSAVVNQEELCAYVFRNYCLPWRVRSQYMGSSAYKVWEATRASAAAPTYFEECRLGNLLHQDGGILVNNPTAVAIHEAKLLWPNSPIQCVMSFGTGRSVPSSKDSSAVEQSSNISSWRNKFKRIVDSATDTEGVHTMLSDLLPANLYFRFNPYLTEMLSMVEIDPKKLEQLEQDAIMYLRRNDDKFQQAAKALMEPRTYVQRAFDYIKLKKELLGFTSKL